MIICICLNAIGCRRERIGQMWRIQSICTEIGDNHKQNPKALLTHVPGM